MTRPEILQDFLDTVLAAFTQFATDPAARSSLARISNALKTPSTISECAPARLSTCEHLAYAADPARFADPSLRAAITSFLRLEPSLTWWHRKGPTPKASANFAEGHANTTVIGTNGLERRTDVTLGVSLVAPHVRYPNHDHPPEETYLVLSRGEFRQGDGPWFEPGIGGTLFNTPNIMHAMRSGEDPLFAMWILWTGSE